MFNFLFGIFGRNALGTISRFKGALGEAQQYAIEDLVETGIAEALAEMEGMVGNPGQQAIYEKYIIDAFPAAAQDKLIGRQGNYLTTEDIDMPYKDAVIIILETGCEIVNSYYEMAQDIDTVLDYI